VAAYLTGARLRFASHHIDNSLTESEFIVQVASSGKAVHVKLNPAVYFHEVKSQMRKIESGKFTSGDIDVFLDPQWAYARPMVSKPLPDSFFVRALKEFKWPKPPVCRPWKEKR